MPCPVICWELLARDLRKQQDFFGRLFDWEISGKPGQNWASVASGMADGTITQATPPASDIVLTVQVEDVAATVDKAIRLGARVVNPPAPYPDGSMASLIRDPEGNLLWVSKPPAGS